MPRPRAVLLSVLLVALGACGEDGPGGPSTTLRPDSTSLPSTTAGASSTTVVALRYDKPGAPTPLGTGFIDGASPDGSALYVEEEDPVHSPRGCEGQREPFLYRLPVAGGAKEAVGNPGEPLRGVLLRGQGGRIAIVAGCEEFFSSLRVGTETADGYLQDLKTLELSSNPRFSGAFGWSGDGTHLLAARASTPPTVVRVDPATGATTNLFSVSGAEAVSQVGQLADGTYVLAAEGEVTTRDAAGAVKVRAVAAGFELTPDRRGFALYGEGLNVVSLDQGAPTVLLAPDAGKRIFTARFSPDGRALVITRRAGEDTEVAVVGTSGGGAPVQVAPPGRLARAYFTGDGRAIAFNQLTITDNPPAATATVLLSRFS